MHNLINIFGPAGVVAIIFFIYWLFSERDALMHVLSFGTIKPNHFNLPKMLVVMVGIVLWLYAGLAFTGVVYLLS